MHAATAALPAVSFHWRTASLVGCRPGPAVAGTVPAARRAPTSAPAASAPDARGRRLEVVVCSNMVAPVSVRCPQTPVRA